MSTGSPEKGGSLTVIVNRESFSRKQKMVRNPEGVAEKSGNARREKTEAVRQKRAKALAWKKGKNAFRQKIDGCA